MATPAAKQWQSQNGNWKKLNDAMHTFHRQIATDLGVSRSGHQPTQMWAVSVNLYFFRGKKLKQESRDMKEKTKNVYFGLVIFGECVVHKPGWCASHHNPHNVHQF